VLCGDAIAKRVPLAWVRGLAAAAFVVLGVFVLLEAAGFISGSSALITNPPQ
jgi:hypothetical protein